jgi:hypothetical protein
MRILSINIVMETADRFFHQNKKHKYRLNDLPDLTMSDEEIALWILQGGAGAWLELDLYVDHKSFFEEYNCVKGMFVTHRDGATGEGTHDGWEACALHGIEWDKTNVWQTYDYETEPDYAWTKAGVKCIEIQKFFNSLPCQQLARVRFMKLKSKGWISPHNDKPDSDIDWNMIFEHPLPINIAIEHPQDCHMVVKDNGVVPFVNGKAFLVNIFNEHSVINYSNKDRIHVIGHLLVGNRKNEYCSMLANSYRKQYVLQG